MFAYARVALQAVLPQSELPRRDLTQLEKVTLEGEGGTWEEAQRAVDIPEGAVVLAWARWPI